MLLLLYTLLCSLAFACCSPSISRRTLVARDEPRNVYLIIDSDPQERVTLPNGKTVFYAHTSVFVAGNSVNGPLKIEYGRNPMFTDGEDHGLFLRVFDGGLGKTDFMFEATSTRRIEQVGQVDLDNNEIFDTVPEKGPVWEAMDDDPTYRVGSSYKGNINGCNALSKRIIGKLGLSVPESLNALYDGATAFQETEPDVEVKVRYIIHERIVFGETRHSRFLRTGACERKMAKRAGACGWKQDQTDVKGGVDAENELSLDPNASERPSGELALEDDVGVSKVPAKGGPLTPPTTETQTTMTRAAGVIKSFTAVGKAALAGLGAAGAVVGAVFVILDFIDHNWVGGAIGAIGLAAGAAIGVFASGPVGWIVGGIVAALFAILPGLFKTPNPPPKITDIQGIIQWKMFGDAAHTGNEQCQKGTDDVPGNPDCQALYGSGTLATVLGMNNFDAIAYLVQVNQGYPIAIKDMAPTWYVIDPKKDNDGADKVATINCNNDLRCQPPDRPPLHPGPNPNKRDCIPRDSPDYCKNPTFQINRGLIKLPHLDQTADKVFDRLIPNDKGDCKLVAYPGESKFADFGLTITGLPSAIACGLTAGINVDGTVIPLDAPSIGSHDPPVGSSANQSTDGQGGSYVAPPPAAPFAPLGSDKYACITYTGQSICLPPGKYQKQSGLGYEIGSTTALTLPQDWSLETYWITIEINRPPAGGGRQPNPNKLKRDTVKNDHTYTSNQDSSNDQFIQDMQGIQKNQNGEALMTVKAPNDGQGPDPVCCLYNAPSLGGDVICLGVGGGDLPVQWKKQAQSINCLNGGQIWIYADKYGDTGGALINGHVDDLKEEPYGDKATFSQNVVAAWISKQL